MESGVPGERNDGNGRRTANMSSVEISIDESQNYTAPGSWKRIDLTEKYSVSAASCVRADMEWTFARWSRVL